jgi:hypothetical protein
MMRKVMVAMRVFLERSWRVPQDDGDGARHRTDVDVRLSKAADCGIIEEIRGIVESVEEWEGWALDVEVKEYIADKRFDRLRG